MAYIKNIPIKKTVQNAIKYITNPKKTENHTYISDSGINFRIADVEFEKIRKAFKKDEGIKAHHFVQSFDPKHGVTPEEANKIGKELAEKQFGKLGFDFIVATHVDTGVIHNHILVNSVSRTTGKKYNHDKRTYKFLRQLNINVCRSNGVPAVDSPILDEEATKKDHMELGKFFRSKPYIKTHAYDSWSEKQLLNGNRIRTDINSAIKEVSSWDEFVLKMQSMGYKVDWKTKQGTDKKYVTYTPEGAAKGKRDRSLGLEYYSKDAIIKRIAQQLERKSEKEDKTDKLLNGKIRKITIKNTRSHNKTFKRAKYYIDPYWDKRYSLLLGESYRKRSSIETSLIKIFLKKKEKTTESFKGNRVDYTLQNSSRMESDDLTKTIDLIKRYNLKNENSVESAKSDLALEVYMIQKEQEEMKRELKNINNIVELLEIRDKYKDVFEKYNSLNGKEQMDYFYKNKIYVQSCAVAIRQLEREKISFSDPSEAKKIVKDLESKLQGFNDDLVEKAEDMKRLDFVKRTIVSSRKSEKHERDQEEK